MHQGIHLSFRTKIAIMIILAMITVSTGTVVSVGFEMQRILTDENKTTILASKKIIDARVANILREVNGYSLLISKNPQLMQGIREKNVSSLQKYGKDVLAAMHLDFITVLNSEGIVIARGHSPEHGDSQKNKYIVQEALDGEMAVGIARGNLISFSFRAAAPVYDEGKITGAVLLGYNLASLPFVDAIKQDMNVECTVFDQRTRIATTIMERSGKRALGTELKNQGIGTSVLTKGMVYEGQNELFGSAYDTVYWPLRDLQGKIQGMLFLGKDRWTINSTIHHLILFLACVIFGISFLVALIALVYAGKLTSPLKKCTLFAGEIARGNLDTVMEIDRNDDIGMLARSLQTMVANLKNRIDQAKKEKKHAQSEKEKTKKAMKEAEEARESADQARIEGIRQAALVIEDVVARLNSASMELAVQSKEITQGTKRQSRRTQETATAVDQMNTTVFEVAKNASHASEISEEAKANALQGEIVVSRAVDAIKQVQQQVIAMKDSLDGLGSQADGIGQIINMISDIADQTNLLALNAAIEAARAGNAGRGFAVVADEVRKLAEKTMQATKTVGKAVRSIQNGARDNIMHMDTTVTRVIETTDLANQAGLALHEIVQSSGLISQQIISIAAASEQQSVASEEISRSVEDINHVTIETAHGMVQTQKATAELAELAGQLDRIIHDFRSG